MGWSEFCRVSDFSNPFALILSNSFPALMVLKYLHLWVALPLGNAISLLTTFDIDWIHGSQEFSSSHWHIRWISSGLYTEISGLIFILIEGVVKVIATAFFIFFGVETLGRKVSLFISAMGMGILFYIIGAILKTHPSLSANTNVADLASPPPASKAIAAMFYIYVCFYSMGWGNEHYPHIILDKSPSLDYFLFIGPLPWVYVADIFPTRTRHYGLAFASASQWLWGTFHFYEIYII